MARYEECEWVEDCFNCEEKKEKNPNQKIGRLWVVAIEDTESQEIVKIIAQECKTCGFNQYG